RIRMNAIFSDRVYMRSLATRGSETEISKATEDTVALLQASAFDLIIIETSGIGQGDAEITEIADLSMYVMTSEFGAPTQLEKIDMIDYADFIVINKFEQKGSEDAFSQVRKQYERSHMLFGKDQTKFPVFGTIASRFNDSGTNSFFAALIDKLNDEHGWDEDVSFKRRIVSSDHANIIPNDSVHYLREISATVRNYHERAKEQSEIARKLYKLQGVEAILQEEATKNEIKQTFDQYKEKLEKKEQQLLGSWDGLQETYAKDTVTFPVRDKEITMNITTISLSGLKIPKVAFPRFADWGDRLMWLMKENVPGHFPYTAGVFP